MCTAPVALSRSARQRRRWWSSWLGEIGGEEIAHAFLDGDGRERMIRAFEVYALESFQTRERLHLLGRVPIAIGDARIVAAHDEQRVDAPPGHALQRARNLHYRRAWQRTRFDRGELEHRERARVQEPGAHDPRLARAELVRIVAARAQTADDDARGAERPHGLAEILDAARRISDILRRSRLDRAVADTREVDAEHVEPERGPAARHLDVNAVGSRAIHAAGVGEDDPRTAGVSQRGIGRGEDSEERTRPAVEDGAFARRRRARWARRRRHRLQ